MFIAIGTEGNLGSILVEGFDFYGDSLEAIRSNEAEEAGSGKIRACKVFYDFKLGTFARLWAELAGCSCNLEPHAGVSVESNVSFDRSQGYCVLGWETTETLLITEERDIGCPQLSEGLLDGKNQGH